ncbi:MAG: hypothetical protein CL912_12655 [Deltaproteobacteria bacterium]|nr:hypothetical protein [Deltaproteobacteria bacterium]
MPRPTSINLHLTSTTPLGILPPFASLKIFLQSKNADILLLGCGDFRNILLTAYADTASTK